MSREKKLVKNAAILAIGQLSSKVFTFLLLPIYTSLLAPDDFGTIDVLQTVISLALYFVTLQIENAVFRFVIENRTNQENQIGYVASAGAVLLVMAGISTVIIGIIHAFCEIPYFSLVMLALLIGGFQYIAMMNPTLWNITIFPAGMRSLTIVNQ